jgi:ABC-type amino acid transport substrate-binding protein
MTTYKTTSRAGVDFGQHEGDSPEAALDALAVSARLADRIEALVVAGDIARWMLRDVAEGAGVRVELVQELVDAYRAVLGPIPPDGIAAAFRPAPREALERWTAARRALGAS